MKTLFIILLPFLAMGQFRLNETESFNFSIIVDPYASFKEKGLCIGAEIEYTGAVYTRLGVATFPKLTDGYTDITGGFGAVFTSGYFDTTTYYAGVRLGVIIRQAANGTAGFEAGINHKLSDNFIIGIRGTYDYRSDWKFYGCDSGWQYSTFVKLGYSW